MGEFNSEMIQKAAAGDQDAVTELYERTYSSIYHTVKALIADEDTVLDIIQDSYIKGFQSLEQLDAPESFKAWMKRIAANKAKDYLKKKKPILFTEMSDEDGEEIDFQDARLDYCPEEVLDRQETTRLLNEILDTLSEDQRLVIGMFYYEEMSVREIAEILGCSENTVKSRLSYGRKKVEVKVRELEKKGTKLYSLAPVPFLLWLFRMDAEAAEVPSAEIQAAIAAECSAGGAAAKGAADTAAAAAGIKTAAAAGTKALTVKIMAGVLAAALAGGAAAAIFSPAAEKNETVEQVDSSQDVSLAENDSAAFAETEETVFSVTADEAYEGIIGEYLSVINTDRTSYLNAPESYFHGDYASVRYYHMYHADRFYYAYYDIDRNGMEEMLIGFGNDGSVKIVDLYGFDGEQAVQLIHEPTLGDRSEVLLLEDGTLYLSGGSGAAQANHSFLEIDGCGTAEADASTAAEAKDIVWNNLGTQEETAGVSFDAVLEDIRTVLTVPQEDYDSNTEYYDAQYSHLGNGVVWMLLHRESGIYTMCIWNTEFDIDSDGEAELCIGRGVKPGEITLIAAYKRSGETIVGDAINNYSDQPLEAAWDYLGG